MNHVDSKFINLLSAKLQKFKRVKSNLYNFRCPICGDSQKNKSKTRGYLYSVKADVNFKCHNCGASMTFSSFLKQQDPILHKQYVFERFKDDLDNPLYLALLKEEESLKKAKKFKRTTPKETFADNHYDPFFCPVYRRIC